jgi:protein gp37
MDGAAKYDSPEGLDTMLELEIPYVKGGRVQPYPMAFLPTFHRYRLDEPKIKTKGVKIFVSSMGDLFGDWVPDKWITDVIKAIAQAPQHTYIFLTKNPGRYFEYFEGAFQDIPEEYDFNKVKIMLGTTVTNQNDVRKLSEAARNFIDFLSIEPLLDDIDITELLYHMPCCSEETTLKWVIVGAQTGPGAVPPKPEWVQSIINQARAAEVPIFLKDNLKWPEMIQEFPEGMGHGSV